MKIKKGKLAVVFAYIGGNKVKVVYVNIVDAKIGKIHRRNKSIRVGCNVPGEENFYNIGINNDSFVKNLTYQEADRELMKDVNPDNHDRFNMTLNGYLGQIVDKTYKGTEPSISYIIDRLLDMYQEESISSTIDINILNINPKGITKRLIRVNRGADTLKYEVLSKFKEVVNETTN